MRSASAPSKRRRHSVQDRTDAEAQPHQAHTEAILLLQVRTWHRQQGLRSHTYVMSLQQTTGFSWLRLSLHSLLKRCFSQQR